MGVEGRWFLLACCQMASDSCSPLLFDGMGLLFFTSLLATYSLEQLDTQRALKGWVNHLHGFLMGSTWLDDTSMLGPQIFHLQDMLDFWRNLPVLSLLV